MNIQVLIIVFLFAHLIGDFWLQTNWAATNKHHNWLALGQHILYYSTTLLVVGTFIPGFSWVPLLLFVAINGGAHFIIDAVTSRMTSRFWPTKEGQNMRNVFHVIGTDQFLHQAILVGSISLLLVVI